MSTEVPIVLESMKRKKIIDGFIKHQLLLLIIIGISISSLAILFQYLGKFDTTSLK